MSIETALYAVLNAQCTRVFPDVAPVETALPYVVWQMVGGPSPVYTENTPTNQAAAFVQITVWDQSRLGANALSRQIEAALMAATTMQARPLSALTAAFDDGNELRGSMQDFEIWAPR